MPQNNKVWVVSYITSYTLKTEPVVTVFNNKEAAERCYTYFKKKYGTVYIDEAPLYNRFKS